jgi:Spy/CpxP family protein refolding chaperone
MQPFLPLLAALPALAAPAPAASAPAPLAFLQARLASRLDLSADQQARIQAVLRAHRPVLRERAEALRQTRRPLVDALLNPITSDTELRQTQALTSAAAADLVVAIHAVVRDLDPILTAEQKVKAHAALAAFRSHLDGLRALALGL